MNILSQIKNRDPGETEFQQAVEKVIETIQPALERNPEYRQAGVLERITEDSLMVFVRCAGLDPGAGASAIQELSLPPLSPTRHEEDSAEVSLRPSLLREFVGQDALKEKLRIFIDAARRRRPEGRR